MCQKTFAGSFETYWKSTRKEKLLKEMDQIIPWKELTKVIAQHYPKPKSAGRRPIGVERMLRIYCTQHWFNLSDPGAEEAIYDSRAMQDFAGIDLGRDGALDESTICKFRHLMEKHNLGAGLLSAVTTYLEENGIKVSRGTIVDATIINTPTSTKNKDKARDPDMDQTKKGSRNKKLTDSHRMKNRNKSKVRAKVERVFQVMKCQFGFRKARYQSSPK